MIIGILYTAAVSAMIHNFVTAAKPVNMTPTVQELRTSLNRVRESAYGRDPAHMRATEITDQEAAQVAQDLLTKKGTIINVNFTLVMQALNFAILLMIMYGWLWDPMLAFLDRRRAIIKKGLQDAAEQSHHADQLREQRQKELAELRDQRSGILDEARNTAEQERRAVVEHAQLEAKRLIQQAHERTAEDVRRARAALREEVADLSARIAETVLQREVSRADHDRLIDQMVQQMADGATTPGQEGTS